MYRVALLLSAGGEPSTWLPPGTLVELTIILSYDRMTMTMATAITTAMATATAMAMAMAMRMAMAMGARGVRASVCWRLAVVLAT